MKHNKLFFAVALACSALTGCGGGDEGDDVTIIVEGTTPTPTPAPTPTTPTPTGNCAVVVEASFVSYNASCSVGTLSGTVNADFELTNDVEWRLEGTVKVGGGNVTVADDAAVQAIKDAGVTLSIEAGTNIKAFDTGSLLVTRGSKIMAEGTASSPITFSSLDQDFEGYGEWGGIIIQGFAPQYGKEGTGACFGTGTVCNVTGEGGTEVAVYGGNDPADDSGVLRYVRIAEGGLVAGPNNEINGLTLQGVGYTTDIEYVQVHGNLDDGIEWFGGTVNARHIVLTNNDDDDIDFDEGYKGNIQYALVQKDPNKLLPTGSNDPRGIEANSSDAEYVPETEAVLANLTIVGGPAANASGIEQPGMRLRGAVTVDIYNSSVQGFETGCIRIDDANTDGVSGNDAFSVVGLTNVIGDCTDGFYDKRAADTEVNLSSATLTYSTSYAIKEAVANLSSAPTIIAVNNGSGFVFDNTDYVGAVDPGAATGWWEGWTIPGSLASPEPVETSFASCNTDKTICTLSGIVNEDYTMVRGVEWRLDGEVQVGNGNVSVANSTDVATIKANGVTLTIEAGVHVRAFDDGTLLVTRGSKLMAIGSPASPITFSSLADDNFDGEGEWGGVILQGFAPQYGKEGTGVCYGSGTICNVTGEGGSGIGKYAGNDPADNSGTLKYVRIAEGGLVAGPNNEVNGLTLQGVGYGTTLDYIQVHSNLDDGVEWFGGTVNATHLVLTGNDDDDIDYDEGYMGNIQFAIVRKNPTKASPTGSNDPRGIEANSSDAEYVPETNATIANVLIIGGPAANAAGIQQPGMRLRGAVTTAIYNSAVRDFDTGCIRIDDADLDSNPGNGFEALSNITLVNVFGDCGAGGFYDKRAADSETNSLASSVALDSAYALTDGAASVAAPTITAVNNGSGFVFEATDYVGAVGPGTAASEAWWADWIIEGSLD